MNLRGKHAVFLALALLAIIGVPKLRHTPADSSNKNYIYFDQEIELGQSLEIPIPFKSRATIQLYDLDSGKNYGALLNCSKKLRNNNWQDFNKLKVNSEIYYISFNKQKDIQVIISQKGDLYYSRSLIKISEENWKNTSKSFYLCGNFPNIKILSDSEEIKIDRLDFEIPFSLQLNRNKKILSIVAKKLGNYQLSLVPRNRSEKTLVNEIKVRENSKQTEAPEAIALKENFIILSPTVFPTLSVTRQTSVSPIDSPSTTNSPTSSTTSSPTYSPTDSPSSSTTSSPTSSETISPSPEDKCGNMIIDQGEECDDGNKNDGDGCDKDCKCSVDILGDQIVIPDGSRENVIIKTNNQSKLKSVSIAESKAINSPVLNIANKGLLEFEINQTETKDEQISLKVKNAHWYATPDKECWNFWKQSLYNVPVTAKFVNGCVATKNIEAKVTFPPTKDEAKVKFNLSGGKWSLKKRKTTKTLNCCATLSDVTFERTCEPHLEVSSTHQYYNTILAEEQRHCEQNKAGLPWSQGGYPKFSFSKLVKKLTKKESSTITECITVNNKKGQTLEKVCQRAKDNIYNKVISEVERLEKIMSSTHVIGTKEACWKEKTAKDYINMIKGNAVALYLECAYPACKDTTQPEDPFLDYRNAS